MQSPTGLLRLAVLAAALASVVAATPPARAAEDAVAPPDRHFSFQGIFGTHDRAAAQRGLQVYVEVCATCHSLSHVAFRHLAGIGFGEEEIKALAERYQVTDGPNDAGEMFQRPAIASDTFVAPFPNEQAARAANNGQYPPDLSLITKARADGANYVSALFHGYVEPPADAEVMPGTYYNLYFPGHQIAMPPVLSEGAVTYQDGTPATLDQMTYDVASFLNWAADPHMEARKQTGVKVVLFLLVVAGLMYAVKRKVWEGVH
jgi:ubiquinol-cytochrome c reductase cytochrome c1 subunit